MADPRGEPTSKGMIRCQGPATWSTPGSADLVHLEVAGKTSVVEGTVA